MEFRELALAVVVAFFAAGFVKGAVGLGLPTVAIGLLSLLVTPAQAAALLIAPAFVTNVWQMMVGGQLRELARRFAPLLALQLPAVIAFGAISDQIARSWLELALGTTLAVYAVLLLRGLQLTIPARREPVISALVGFLSGAITGLTGTFVVPAVPYFSQLKLTSDALVQALGLYFTVASIALWISLTSRAVVSMELAGWSVGALIPVGIGMFLGQRVRDRASPATFRRGFAGCIGALGLYMVLHAIQHWQ